MGLTEAVASVFRNYATFSGRARRAEYWWFVLFNILVLAVLSALDAAIFGYEMHTVTGNGYSFSIQSPGVLNPIWSLFTFLPGLAVAVRRLHDTGRSGAWLLILLVPVIGVILLLVWLISRGDTGANLYGPDPINRGGTDLFGIPRVPRR